MLQLSNQLAKTHSANNTMSTLQRSSCPCYVTHPPPAIRPPFHFLLILFLGTLRRYISRSECHGNQTPPKWKRSHVALSNAKALSVVSEAVLISKKEKLSHQAPHSNTSKTTLHQKNNTSKVTLRQKTELSLFRKLTSPSCHRSGGASVGVLENRTRS